MVPKNFQFKIFEQNILIFKTLRLKILLTTHASRCLLKIVLIFRTSQFYLMQQINLIYINCRIQIINYLTKMPQRKKPRIKVVRNNNQNLTKKVLEQHKIYVIIDNSNKSTVISQQSTKQNLNSCLGITGSINQSGKKQFQHKEIYKNQQKDKTDSNLDRLIQQYSQKVDKLQSTSTSTSQQRSDLQMIIYDQLNRIQKLRKLQETQERSIQKTKKNQNVLIEEPKFKQNSLEILKKMQNTQTCLKQKIKQIKEELTKKSHQNKQLQSQNTKLTNQKRLLQKNYNVQITQLINQLQIQRQKSKAIQEIKQKYIQRVSITPDTTTKAWESVKFNRNGAKVYVSQKVQDNWLYSYQSLPPRGQFQFTIKVIKMMNHTPNIQQGKSFIKFGIMESTAKQLDWQSSQYHGVYLNVWAKKIKNLNEEQNIFYNIECSCQSSLPQLPCLINCKVNRQKGQIVWQYNGKRQAESNIPLSWKDGRKLCAIVSITNEGDTLEFI